MPLKGREAYRKETNWQVVQPQYLTDPVPLDYIGSSILISLMSCWQGEQMFGLMPLCFATYPAIALRLPHFDEKRLKQSLCHGF